MKIKYGKGECFIDYKVEEISSIVIKYRGVVTLRHDFMTIDSILDSERALIKNVNKNNMLVHGNNQIHIGFLNNPDLDKLFDYLRFCLEQICADKEMESLLKALDGDYVLPGPGGDPIRNPGVLPSGKNIHALDPQSIPTVAAVASAKGVVD